MRSGLRLHDGGRDALFDARPWFGRGRHDMTRLRSKRYSICRGRARPCDHAKIVRRYLITLRCAASLYPPLWTLMTVSERQPPEGVWNSIVCPIERLISAAPIGVNTEILFALTSAPSG